MQLRSGMAWHGLERPPLRMRMRQRCCLASCGAQPMPPTHKCSLTWAGEVVAQRVILAGAQRLGTVHVVGLPLYGVAEGSISQLHKLQRVTAAWKKRS